MLSSDLQRIMRIRDYCAEVERTINRFGSAFVTFAHDADYQRSISSCVLQIEELAGGLTQEYRAKTASRIQWGPIKGMRNWVAHNYANISLDIVWETAVNDIPALKQFCEEQLAGESEN